MRSPFSLFIKHQKNKDVWYVRFYNPKTKTYSVTRSTGVTCTGKKGRKQEAYRIAMEMAKNICLEKSVLFLDYLESFWKEDSQYAKLKRLSDKKPLSSYYIKQNAEGIKHHIKPFMPFESLELADLTSAHIEDWKLWVLEKGVGSRRINAVMQSMSVPVRYAVSRGELKRDPFIPIKKVKYSPKEKGILSREEVNNLIEVKEDDIRVYTSILLAVLAGLRRGEIRGLRWSDIEFDHKIIHVQNNYVDGEGSKPCKWGSERDVLLPTTLIDSLTKLKEINPNNENNDFVFFSLDSIEIPISISTLRTGFSRMLKKSGINKSQQKERNLTLHGMRHTFVTLARMSGIPDITIQALAGHKSVEMMNHYSHADQVIDFDEARSLLEKIS